MKTVTENIVKENVKNINADVNGAFQIMRKVIPNVFGLWDRGCAPYSFIGGEFKPVERR